MRLDEVLGLALEKIILKRRLNEKKLSPLWDKRKNDHMVIM
jgi:hypothetical protein